MRSIALRPEDFSEAWAVGWVDILDLLKPGMSADEQQRVEQVDLRITEGTLEYSDGDDETIHI